MRESHAGDRLASRNPISVECLACSFPRRLALYSVAKGVPRINLCGFDSYPPERDPRAGS
jgi:hypothetical protein